MKKKINTDDIDENFLLSTFRDKEITPDREPEKEEEIVSEEEAAKENRNKPVSVPSGNESKNTTRRKKGSISYGDTFFKRNEFKTRQCVYISLKNHTIISKIIRMQEDNDLSVGGYIDLILSEHLEQYKDEIMEAFRKWKEKETNDLTDLM